MFKNHIIKALYKIYPFSRGRRFLNPLYKYISGYEIVRDINYNKILLNLDNYIDSIIYLNGSYEQKNIEFLETLFSQHKCTYFIDVGANIGIYSMYFANNSNLKMSYSFEPNPSNYAQLSANIFLNNISEKVKLFNVALSDKTSQGQLFVVKEKTDDDFGKYNAGMHSLNKNLTRDMNPVAVNIYRGDDLINLSEEIICLKIDVEGHELNVLKGISNLLNSNKCIIMIEIFDEMYTTTNNFLLENKFKKINLDLDFGLNYFYKNF